MATGNGDNLYLVFGVESERDRGRESDWRRLIVFLLSVCRQWLWIYNTGGIFSWWMAGEYPAAFVSSLIKWQIVIQEMCIRPWSCRYFFYGNLLFLGCTCLHGGVNAEMYPRGFLFFFRCPNWCISPHASERCITNQLVAVVSVTRKLISWEIWRWTFIYLLSENMWIIRTSGGC